jgi:hypothetical protein
MQAVKALDNDGVVAKAFYRAADALGLSRQEIKDVIGLSEPTISRNLNSLQKKQPVVFDAKTAECALFFIRIYRSLLAVVGGNENKARKWLEAENRYFGGTPRQHLKTLGGLIEVANYLDAMRGKV